MQIDMLLLEENMTLEEEDRGNILAVDGEYIDQEYVHNAKYKKTKQLVMLYWVHDLLSKPVVAKVSDTQDIGSNKSNPNDSNQNKEGVDFEQDQLLFVTANSEEGEQFSIFEDLMNNLMTQQLSGVEEVDDCLGHEERGDSDEDQSDVECNSDANDLNVARLDACSQLKAAMKTAIIL
jgi:hypothetical protein